MPHADLFPSEWQPQVVLMAALKVGLIEALLDRPLPPETVARELGLDERGALRVIRVLLDAGYLEQRQDGVVVAPGVRASLDPSDPAYVGDRLLHVHGLLVRWLRLPTVLREGGPAPDERSDESLRAFIGSMRAGARRRARPLADLLAALFPATRTVLDVGGGPGTHALAFQEKGWRVTVLDFPEVIDLMAGDLASAGIAAIEGDATEGIPASDFDLVYCGNLFHALSPGDCATLTKNAADALAPGGALAVFDFLSDTGLRSSLFAVNMLVATTAGDVYAEGDYRDWCESAGLRRFAVREVEGQSQRLLTAVRPAPRARGAVRSG